MAILFATKTTDGKPIGFKCVRATTWEDEFVVLDEATGNPVNLTGIDDLVMRIRTRVESPDVVMELSVSNQRLTVLDAPAGRVGLAVTTAQSLAEFPENYHRKRRYVTDALIVRPGPEYEPAIAGKVTVLPQITRAYQPLPE